MIISVIIPTKNRVNLLKRAIKSVENQICNSILEIVVVNDHSQDETYEYLEAKQSAGDGLFKAIHNAFSKGGGVSRNIGVSQAKGEFIAFLDDDDEWLPMKIAIQEKFLNDNTFIASRYFSITRNSKIPKSSELHSTQYYFPTFREVFSHSSKFSPSTVLIKKRNFLDIGGFDTKLNANQGRDLFIRYYLKFGYPMVINRKLVIQHQEHSEGRISDNIQNRIVAHQIIYKKHKSILSTREHKDAKRNILLLQMKIEVGFKRLVLIIKILPLLSKKYFIQDCKKIAHSFISN